MRAARPYVLEVPPASSLAGSLFEDLRHACAVDVVPGPSVGAQEWADLLFSRPPTALRLLLRGRDVAVRVAGLRPVVERGTGGTDRVGPFPVLSRTDREVVFGLDDSHLDFRSSVLVDGSGPSFRVVCSTVAQAHNAFGRAYLAPVRVAHPRLVSMLLRRAARRAAHLAADLPGSEAGSEAGSTAGSPAAESENPSACDVQEPK